MTTVINDPDQERHEQQDGDPLHLKNATFVDESFKIARSTVHHVEEFQSSQAHDTGHSTDDQLFDVIHDDSEEDESAQVAPAADVTAHYDNLSESLQSSPIDEDEEEKMEQEIANRLSHLRIDRSVYPSSQAQPQPQSQAQSLLAPKVRRRRRNFPAPPHLNHKNETDCFDIESMLTMDDMDDDEEDEEDADADIHVDDAHYDSHYAMMASMKNSDASFNIHREFLSNETFLKYVMLYGTIYCVARFTLNRYYNHHHHLHNHNNGLTLPLGIDTHGVSQKLILLSNAILTVSKTHHIWWNGNGNGNGHGLDAALLTSLGEQQLNFMDTQNAFHLVMLVLSYFGGKTVTHSQRVSKQLMRLYNLASIGCVLLIKKYKKLSGFYLYAQFWLQLSAVFVNTSKIVNATSRGVTSAFRTGVSRSSLIIHALIMIYSRLYLFTKVVVPIIQKQYRDHQQYMTSAAAMAWLIRNYYKTGDCVYKTFLSKK